MAARDILQGDVGAAARLMRRIEDNDPDAHTEMLELLPHTGNAHIIGVTGAPGTGKSTLLDRLVSAMRKRNQTVGVVVVDPTSPFSGGAILGDRFRMQRHSNDSGVFIRSLASRGRLGGLSASTHDIVAVLDAMGKTSILVETVGAGQDEVEIAALAHTNIVVAVPGAGDGLQTLKAGILECGDIFVINKSDAPGADIAAAQLRAMLELKERPPDSWKPPVVRTSALQNTGVDALLLEIDRHRAHLESASPADGKARQTEKRFFDSLRDRMLMEARMRVSGQADFSEIIESLKAGRTDLHSAVEAAIALLFKANK